MEARLRNSTASNINTIYKEDERVFAPRTIFSRAFRQRLTGATFANSNCIRAKNDVLSKQFPCMSENIDTIQN
jgi:hypothetical protein